MKADVRIPPLDEPQQAAGDPPPGIGERRREARRESGGTVQRRDYSGLPGVVEAGLQTRLYTATASALYWASWRWTSPPCSRCCRRSGWTDGCCTTFTGRTLSPSGWRDSIPATT